MMVKILYLMIRREKFDMNKKAREQRITWWIIWIIIAVGFIGIEAFCTNVISKEKEPFYVYAPSDMKEAFKRALKMSDMSSEYEVIMTDSEENANVVVSYNKENDSSYTQFAFSPYVVAYSYDYSSDFFECELVKERMNLKGYYEISLSNLIDAILNEKEWKDYGLEDVGMIQVAYPDPSTVYWESFYNLMLIAANGGKYPTESSSYSKAVTKLSNFFASDNTYAITDFYEKLSFSGGFNKDIFYIAPEKLFINKKWNVSFFAPTETLPFNYYLKADSLGSRILPNLNKYTDWDSSTFYTNLNGVYYRSKSYPELYWNSRNIKGFRNIFNIVRIPDSVDWQVEKEG